LNTVTIHETVSTMDIVNTESTRTYGTRMSGEELKCVCIIEQVLAQIYFTCHFWCIYIRNCKNKHVSFSFCIHTSICNNLHWTDFLAVLCSDVNKCC